ncbi:AAA family ATPase [Mycobacterium sp. OTB74]|uniref:AAA family ATPase n=1 Tax=Mycobacterium sp. OTB74 TaxID=1853452 RepID=UPI0024772BAA|nr:AAA family ATPase [Mycobacterium sp. OTB74]
MTVDDAGLGDSVEAEVWQLLDADDAVADDTAYLVAAALRGDEELAAQLGGDANAPQRPEPATAAEPEPLRAFVRSITVEGFRGIGRRTTLEVNPYHGITVISGRNGSGKSSFAEALEYALTGTSYRWANKKSQQWEASWRNLHAGEPASIRVDFAMESDDERTGTTALIGVDWSSDCKLTEAKRWSQIKGQKQAPVGALGWDQALETHRPLMSYDELGGLFEEGQSALYDALNLLLGLDEISAADTRLKQAEKRLGGPRKAATEARARLRQALDGIADPRAEQVKKLTAKAPYDLAAITATTTGTATDQAATIARLRTIAALEVPAASTASQVANELRAAIDECAGGSAAVDNALVARADLLRDALSLHVHAGDGICPVCETGTLDATWRAAAEARLAKADEDAAAHRKVTARLNQARTAAEGFFADVEAVAAIEGVQLATLQDFDAALTNARAVPGALAELPAQVETATAELAAAADALRVEAEGHADELEDAWASTAETIINWVALEKSARADDARLGKVKAAVKWLRNCGDTLRERRMAPMVEQAGEIWSRMRHESNVDIGNITLEGAATRRHVTVDATVDGVPAGALSVMSQGELHALALALFIPRATTPASPFRFLVLDDPIQAMDPAKIGGFLDVLVELANTRQVIVFSHDDRLPAAIRARSVPAQLLDVTREQGSIVVVRENDLPANRYIADAMAVILDEDMDAVVKRKATPGLFRMAVEAAAHQRFFTDRARAGATYHETDAAWDSAKRTQECVALALMGDSSADIKGWKSYRSHRSPTLAICANGVHNGAILDRGTVRDLRETVRDIVENR